MFVSVILCVLSVLNEYFIACCVRVIARMDDGLAIYSEIDFLATIYNTLIYGAASIRCRRKIEMVFDCNDNKSGLRTSIFRSR